MQYGTWQTRAGDVLISASHRRRKKVMPAILAAVLGPASVLRLAKTRISFIPAIAKIASTASVASQGMNMATVPDIPRKAHIIGISGTLPQFASPANNGWFLSDVSLFNYLLGGEGLAAPKLG